MDNRRHDYRHPFPPRERLQIELLAPDRQTRVGEILNLSVGGMAVRLDRPGTTLPRDGRYLARFALYGTARLEVPATLVHAREGEPPGFRFLPLADLTANEARERTLWLFLLDEQRRLRRETADRPA